MPRFDSNKGRFTPPAYFLNLPGINRLRRYSGWLGRPPQVPVFLFDSTTAFWHTIPRTWKLLSPMTVRSGPVKKLFVGNLPYGANETDVQNFFADAGVNVDS